MGMAGYGGACLYSQYLGGRGRTVVSFKASLGYTARPISKNEQKQRNKERLLQCVRLVLLKCFDNADYLIMIPF
jgi:hypothetical protein